MLKSGSTTGAVAHTGGHDVTASQVDPALAPPQPLVDEIRSLVEGGTDELIAFRRRLHAEPEVSYQEHSTTEWVMERLYVAGLRPRRLESGTGLVCDIGEGTPRVGLRADIDALGLTETADVPYRSRVDGVSHACGHDVHTTTVLGAGLVLNRLIQHNRLDGAVRIFFEPGEESVPGGAVEIIDAGWTEGLESIFALHCEPKLDVGRVGVRFGPITSASDMVEITLSGPGGHTARPHLTVDLIRVLGIVATQLPEVLQRHVKSHGRSRLVFGSVQSGDAPNVIPSRAVIRGSLRTPDGEAWQVMPEFLAAAVTEVLEPTGAAWELNHVRGVAPVVNNPVETRIAAAAAAALLGEGNVTEAEHSWGGDSFGWFTDAIPGTYIRLGTHNPAWGRFHDLHHPAFEVDERAIAHGAALLASIAARQMMSTNTNP